MTKVNSYIDHTNLNFNASSAELEKLLAEAKAYDFNSICIRSKEVKNYAQQYRVSATLSFPEEIFTINNKNDLDSIRSNIGKASLEEKKLEAKLALKNGALELDPVIYLDGDIEKELELYLDVIARSSNVIASAAKQSNSTTSLYLKPIFSCETQSYPEISQHIKIFATTCLKFIKKNPETKIKFAFKNSTGFIKKNEDFKHEFNTTSVKLISFIATELDKYDPEKLLCIKAAGGIKNHEQALEIIEAAATRLSHIGTSSGTSLQGAEGDVAIQFNNN